MGDERVVVLRRFVVALVVGFVFLRVVGPTWSSLYSYDFPDSSSYRDVAAQSPFSLRFWFGERPPTYPLLLWLLGLSSPAAVAVQTALSFAAWIWLLTVVRATIQNRWVAYSTIVVLLAIALQARWIFWNTLILTESLSATLAVAAVAAWLVWWREPTRRHGIVVAGLMVAWMLLRDSNAVSWLVVAAPAALVAYVTSRRAPSRRRQGAAAILGIAVIAGGYSAVAQITTARGETSIHNNVGLRWLPDREMTDFMVARGMPLDPALEGRNGRTAWDDGEAFLVAPDLAEYRAWADGRRGRSAALSSFVVKAPWYVRRYDTESTVYGYLEPDYLFDYDHYQVHTRFPANDLGPFDPIGSSSWSSAIWALIGIGGLVAIAIADRRSLALTLGLLWVSVIVDWYLAFSADAVEVARHLTGPWLRFAVLSIVIAAFAIDSWWSTHDADSDSDGARAADSDSDSDSDDGGAGGDPGADTPTAADIAVQA